jgi:quinol monooxygenase YgiN
MNAIPDHPLVVINVFTVGPHDQQKLIDMLIDATEGQVDHEAGFLGAVLHRGLDGKKVTMYAQWKDLESYNAMRQGRSSLLLSNALAIATFEPAMYEIVRTFAPPAAAVYSAGATREE